jgi:hypothetical protein
MQQVKNYYLSTTRNKEEILPVYNKQQKRINTCLQLATIRNYYLSTTRNKEELLRVYNEQQIRIFTCLKQTTNKE